MSTNVPHEESNNDLQFVVEKSVSDRRKRRSSYFNKSKLLGITGSGEDESIADENCDDQFWKKLYKDRLEKEKQDWKDMYYTIKHNYIRQMNKTKSLVLHEHLSLEEKDYLKKTPKYDALGNKLDHLIESCALVEKVQQISTSLISNTIEMAESELNMIIQKLCNDTLEKHPVYINQLLEDNGTDSSDTQYDEPFLPDFSEL